MKILINPTQDQRGSGTTSQIRYENFDFINAINQMFHIRKDEKIAQLEFDNSCITARIEKR